MEQPLLEFLVCVKVEDVVTATITKTLLIYAESPQEAATAARMVGNAADKKVTVIGVTENEKNDEPSETEHPAWELKSWRSSSVHNYARAGRFE